MANGSRNACVSFPCFPKIKPTRLLPDLLQFTQKDLLSCISNGKLPSEDLEEALGLDAEALCDTKIVFVRNPHAKLTRSQALPTGKEDGFTDVSDTKHLQKCARS